MSRYDIAIIGMGGIFPKANNVEEYWKNIVSGDSFFSKMPESLWRIDNFASPERANRETSYTTIGAFIEGFEFPFLKYKLPPNTLKGVDPAQLLTLEAVGEALGDAGIEARSQQLSEAVTIIGSSGVDAFAHSTTYLQRHGFLKKLRPLLEKKGVPASIIDALFDQFAEELAARGHEWNAAIASVGAIASSVSNRVAQVFGVGGFNMTVDGACASSLVAIDTACQALMVGDTRLAIAGGADLGTNPAIYIGFSRVDGLSPTGTSNPFDHSADGLVIGEGVGVVVLKRLEDALDDGDRIRAVIRGIGSSSDGAGQAVYAPSVEGRAEALRKALIRAETSHSEVQYLEAHATSTIVGDANEYDAISTVYGSNREAPDPLVLGSVKQQIGHLKAAAGVAGLIKTVLAMNHSVFPHMPRFSKLTPGAELPSEALLVPTTTSPWNPSAGGKRVAAVTANGFGGVNYHVILEQGDSYQRPASRPEVPREIAIVGISCRVAGAADVDTFWENVTGGVDSFTTVDPSTVGWEDHLDTGPEKERITTHVLGRIDDYEFPLLRHKIFPTAASQISPTQLLGVDLADRLLMGAGFELAEAKNVGVSVGSMHDDYFPSIFRPMVMGEYIDAFKTCPAAEEIDRATLEECLAATAKTVKSESPPVTEHTLPGWMTNVTAGRIANKLNLKGPNFTVDTACSSGLAALVPSIYQLITGDVDAMISGGLNRQLTDIFTTGVCALGAVADRVPRPFDVEGKGFLIGEGGVFYLLKRLADAERDGNEILGVIHAVGGSSESDSKTMVAPSEAAVSRAVRSALSQTSIKAEEIGVVDTHGSANRVSDLVEAQVMASELRPNGGCAPIQLTAIKSHIGHIYGGSGAASMLSTLQSLRTGAVPGIRNLETVRPELKELEGIVEPRKGTAPLAESCIAGAVNALGLGGANYFAIVSSPYSERARVSAVDSPPMMARPREVVRAPAIRASDESSSHIFVCLAERGADFATALSRALGQSPIPEIITEGQDVGARLAVTFDGQESLKSKLGAALHMLEGGHGLAPLESQGIYAAQVPLPGQQEKLAYCFPGQGMQYVTMGRPLYDTDPVFRRVLERVDHLAHEAFGFGLLDHIYGDDEDPEIKKNLGTLVGAQTSVFAIEMALARTLEARGITPDVLIGQSFGEIAALAVAGVWDIDAAYEVVKARIRAGEQIRDAGGPALGMMSLICSEQQRDAILGLIGDRVVLTNINAPSRFILSGELEAIEKTVAVADSFGAKARLLPIGSAFHSRFMEPAREPYRKALESLPCSSPKIPVFSTITGEYVRPELVTSEWLAEHLSTQLVTTVNLVREVNRLRDDGVGHFLELGPGAAFTKMVDAILEGKPHRAAPTLQPKVGDAETFRRAQAFLMALGHLDSAADRRNLPGMFSPDFLDYLDAHEPAVLSLLGEVHGRFLERVKRGATEAVVVQAPSMAVVERARSISILARPAAALAKPAAQLAQVAPLVESADVWVERLREKLVEITGYPQEMLEATLDLEADLGVDSVQRAEIWTSLTTEHGLDPEVRPKGGRTIAALAEFLSTMSGEDRIEPAVIPESAPPVASVSSDVWIERLREKLVDITGYPPEMLEAKLDLEADLGVDSVQRAEIWSALTTKHDLDPELRPKGARTILDLAEFLATMGGGETLPEPGPTKQSPPRAGADAAMWLERLREKLVEMTGYPPEMLEAHLDLEVDLGVDSVQRAEIWSTLTTRYNLDPDARPTGPRTIAGWANFFAGMNAGLSTVEADLPASRSNWVQLLRDTLVDSAGYPRDMLEDDLDLEAELGIDLVHRTELCAAAVGEIGQTATPPPPEARTLRQLGASLETTIGALGGSNSELQQSVPDEDRCRLFVTCSEPVVSDAFEAFACTRALAVVGDGDSLATTLKQRTDELGIEMSTVTTETIASLGSEEVATLVEGCDTVIYLPHHGLAEVEAGGAELRQLLRQETEKLYSTWRVLGPVLSSNPVRVIVPVAQDGGFGANGAVAKGLLGSFPAGFVRALARELPDCRFQILDVGVTEWSVPIAQSLSRIGPALEVGLSLHGWLAPTLSTLTPAVDHQIILDEGDLVIVTGGARGIVFECMLALAERTRCRLLLTGRTEIPKGQPGWLSSSSEEIDDVVRAMEIELVRGDSLSLGEAKRIGAKAKTQWELSRNLARLEAAGIDARYEQCDVTDPDALAALLREVGTGDAIRGVVLGSGVQRSKLLGDLEDEAIRRTVDTKLDPLFSMLDVLDWSRVKLLSAFGSISGLFGNAGQTDYALANDLLAWAVQRIGQIHPHLKAQTIEWCAWVGTGMVSAQEATRFAQAGLTPLDVQSGTRLFVEAVTGAAHRRLAVFNEGAKFTAARPRSRHPVAARPRARLLEPESGNGKGPRALFSLERDPYLEQHCVNDEPVVPGTFVTEIFGEASSQSGFALKDIHFRRPLQVRGSTLEVEVVRDGESLTLLPAVRPELDEMALANLSFSTCRLAEPSAGVGADLGFSQQDLDALDTTAGASFYDLLDETFSSFLRTGPVFRGLLSIAESGDRLVSAVRITDEAAALLEVPGEFVFNPVLADMAVQVAASWSMQKHRVMAIPSEIGSLHVADALRDRDAVVVCRSRELSPERTVVDLAVRDLDGRLIMTMDRLVLKTIARVAE